MTPEQEEKGARFVLEEISREIRIQLRRERGYPDPWDLAAPPSAARLPLPAGRA